MKILVLGAGSIGRRHVSNLLLLNKNIRLDIFDTDQSRLEYFRDFKGAVRLNDELQFESSYDLVLVCTPPSVHLKYAERFLLLGSKVFIEKPLTTDSVKITKFKKKLSRKHECNIAVGYNFRFHKELRQVRDLINSGRLGKVLNFSAEFGQYLPDWRPWQDYRRSYTSRKDLGGGIILDASHEIDSVIWLLGGVRDIFACSGKVSALEVDVEDCAEIIFTLQSG
ncbi:MAG TPA: Gfo/Idh/MocA family oxidoreductase, partial [Firmicutes bacterium]|nr:Gfo/Idh/MocA family oxidoreductase [Bacillota bacterium]